MMMILMMMTKRMMMGTFSSFSTDRLATSMSCRHDAASARESHFATGSAKPLLWVGLATTPLPATHQALKHQHFDASDSNRQALKHHPVANKHSSLPRQTCIGWAL